MISNLTSGFGQDLDHDGHSKDLQGKCCWSWSDLRIKSRLRTKSKITRAAELRSTKCWMFWKVLCLYFHLSTGLVGLRQSLLHAKDGNARKGKKATFYNISKKIIPHLASGSELRGSEISIRSRYHFLVYQRSDLLECCPLRSSKSKRPVLNEFLPVQRFRPHYRV